MSPIVINLQPEPRQDRRDFYGILLVSETEHDFYGPRIHNRHHGHVLQVWENRPSKVRGADPEVIVDPHGRPTTERYSYLWSARATAIAAHHIERAPQGPALRLGDVVELQVHGYSLGKFVVDARPLHDPHLVRVS